MVLRPSDMLPLAVPSMHIVLDGYDFAVAGPAVLNQSTFNST
jgi:hypothetical protein